MGYSLHRRTPHDGGSQGRLSLAKNIYLSSASPGFGTIHLNGCEVGGDGVGVPSHSFATPRAVGAVRWQEQFGG